MAHAGVQLGEIRLYGLEAGDTGAPTNLLNVTFVDNPGGCGGTTEENQCSKYETNVLQLADNLIDEAPLPPMSADVI